MLPCSHLGFTAAALRMMELRAPWLRIDYRIALFGAILPDLVDKPLARLFFGGKMNEGRAFGHSLAFLLLVGFAAWLWRRNAANATLAVGVAFHDLLDAMWLHKGIWLWPLLGVKFLRPTHEAFQGFVHLAGRKLPLLLVLEAAGVIALMAFGAEVMWKKRMRRKK